MRRSFPAAPGGHLSVVTQFVLETLLADPSRELSGREISRSAGLRTGAVRPVLARLEAVHWLQSCWEDDPGEAGRPPRRLYRLSPDGAAAAREALAASGHPVRAAGRWETPLAGRS